MRGVEPSGLGGRGPPLRMIRFGVFESTRYCVEHCAFGPPVSKRHVPGIMKPEGTSFRVVHHRHQCLGLPDLGRGGPACHAVAFCEGGRPPKPNGTTVIERRPHRRQHRLSHHPGLQCSAPPRPPTGGPGTVTATLARLSRPDEGVPQSNDFKAFYVPLFRDNPSIPSQTVREPCAAASATKSVSGPPQSELHPQQFLKGVDKGRKVLQNSIPDDA